MEKVPQKIIILGTVYPYRGGLAAYNERLAREYVSRGADVTVLTFSLQYPSWLFPGKTQYSDAPAPEGLRIERCVNSVNPLNWLRVARKIRLLAPDLVIVKYWLPYMAPCLGSICRMCRKSGIRVVSILDNMVPHEHRPGDKIFSKYFCGSVDGFVAMTGSVMSDVSLFDRTKPRALCPHPLYDSFGDPVDRTEACRRLDLDPAYKYLLFFGLIRDYKGLDLLLEALCDHRFAGHDEWRLVVAGEFYGDGQKYLDAGAPLGDKLIWRACFIPDDEVRYYFCAADLVVQPYKTATQSGVTQIAYHFCRPMLVTAVGGLAEMVPDGVAGYVVDPSPRPIADAVLRWLDEEPDFSEGLRSGAASYSWDRMCGTIDTVYNQTYDNQK